MGLPTGSPLIARRGSLGAAAAGACASATGCLAPGGPQTGRLEKVWGRRGGTPGRLNRPRAIAIDRQDQLYIVDMTPRIQVFTGDGEYLRGWQTPEFDQRQAVGAGLRQRRQPAGRRHALFSDAGLYAARESCSINRRSAATCGSEDGEFQFVTDCGAGFAGQLLRRRSMASTTAFRNSRLTASFCSLGRARPASWASFCGRRRSSIDRSGLLWVTDACNHRVQVFDASGSEAKLVKIWGRKGHAPGELQLSLRHSARRRRSSRPAGRLRLSVRVRQPSRAEIHAGRPVRRPLGARTAAARASSTSPGESPATPAGRMFVLDTYNHRVQRFRL